MQTEIRKVSVLSSELLEAAEAIAESAPKSSDLENTFCRKAISTAYFAVFHKLVEDATNRIIDTGDEDYLHRGELARWYTHGDIRTVSQWIVNWANGGKLPDSVNGLLNAAPADLIKLSKFVLRLQKARHSADYDRFEHFKKGDTGKWITTARDAIELTQRLQGNSVYQRYLMLLLGGPKIARKAA